MAAADPRSNFFETISSICDAYLYNPNSPLRNEEMYIPVEEAKLKSQFVSDDDKAEAAALLPRLKLNRVGTPAADFTFTLRSGSKMDLYEVKADNTIMFFSNPGCEDCKAVIDQLMSLQGLNEAIADGKLAVVNVYPDEDLKEWFAYAPVYPDNWYNGFDQDLAVGGGLYNLRAIPSLYLLDKDKKVIFKDVDPMMLTDYLQPVLAGQPSSSTQSSL
jgi:thiol-disulfide isomerase/thioredoxin